MSKVFSIFFDTFIFYNTFLYGICFDFTLLFEMKYGNISSSVFRRSLAAAESFLSVPPSCFPPFSPFPTPTHEDVAPEELRVLSVLAGPV